MILANKYSPNCLDEVKGHEESLVKLSYFIKNFKEQKKKALTLFGPTGTGKTCSVYAFAKENDYEVLELNASDVRNKSNVEEFMDSAINQMSLFMKPKIILIDEIDGLSGVKDRGGAQAITKILDKTNFPIIMTANDISLDKLSSLIKKSEILEFGEISSKGINERLGEICEKENIEMDDFMLKSIASRAGGDLRAAINDLQTLRNGNKDDLNLIGDRKREEDLNNILRLIFKSKDIKLIENSLGDIKLDELQSWIQSNVVYEYDEIDKAFNYLSKADVFKGRIRKWQYWRFLVYQKFFMSSGVALSKEKKSTNIIKYKRPSIGLMIWQSNMRNSKRKSISKKIAFHFKISEKRAFQMFPDVVSLIKLNNIQKKLGLEENEIEWINTKLF
tara:strand:+ start:524 stop:1693 length:1170 start_codon:yes stop_codon:yes gene_type:complete